MHTHSLLLALTFLSVLAAAVQAEVRVATGHRPTGRGFDFDDIPAPANNDAATGGQWSLVDGERDPNSGDLAVLHDGRVPGGEDQPARNFFFRAGSTGGRLRLDLGRVVAVQQVNTYSWHPGSRGPQVYKLYAAAGTADGFEPAPKRGADPAMCGWTLLANVDTRPKDDRDEGGQHGVSVSDSAGLLGKFRYLLFDVVPTDARDRFSHTFFSEIDVVDADGPALTTHVEQPVLKTFATVDGKYRFQMDVTEAPDLAEWSVEKLQPVVIEWYPRIVALLPSDDFQPATEVLLRYRTDMGGTPASAGRGIVNLNAGWFRRERDGEARGAVVHELVHIVQSYRGRRTNPRAALTPGWIVEGIPDYIRWFLYEPETNGAAITRRNLARANYDASYRITGNFLDWVTRTYEEDLVVKLNAAAREGRYDEALWSEWTGKTLQELGREWKTFHERRLAADE